MSSIRELKPKKILVIHVTRIGDTLLTTPAIRAIANYWPNAEITFLGHPKRQCVLKNIPYIKNVGSITKKTAPFLGHLIKNKYDVAFVFGFDSALVFYARRVAKYLIAWRFESNSINSVVDVSIEKPEKSGVSAAKVECFLSENALGMQLTDYHLDYFATEREKQWARSLLAESAPGNVRWVGFVVESFPTKSYRDWPLKSFIKLAQRISHEFNDVKFLFIGSTLSKSKIDEIESNLPKESYLLATGKYSLRESFSLIDALSLYVGVDTGPTHAAGAMEIPMIALYHWKHPSTIYGSIADVNRILIDVPESGGSASIGDISVNQVYEAARRLLG